MIQKMHLLLAVAVNVDQLLVRVKIRQSIFQEAHVLGMWEVFSLNAFSLLIEFR